MDNSPTNVEATVHAPAKSRRLRLAVVLGLLSAFGPLSLDMYLPSLPLLADDLGTSASMAQLSLTSCMFGLSLGQLVSGPLSDVFGRRIPLLIGLVLYIVASVLCAFGPSIEMFVLIRFIQGLAGSAGIVISRAMVRDLYSGVEMTKFFSLLLLFNGSAPILAPLAGGQLLHVTTWRGIFIVLALIGVALLLAVLFGLSETLPVNRRSKGGMKNTLTTFQRLFRDRVFMGYAITLGLVYTAMFAYISGSSFVLQNIYGVSPQMFSLIFAINGLGIILASQLTGRLAGRISQSVLLMSGLGLAGVGGTSLLAMILTGAGLFAILPPLFLVVSSVGIVNTVSYSLALQNQGQSAGSASALLGLLSYISGGLAAPFVGLAGNDTAVPMGVIIAAADVGAILSYVLLIGRLKTREQE